MLWSFFQKPGDDLAVETGPWRIAKDLDWLCALEKRCLQNPCSVSSMVAGLLSHACSVPLGHGNGGCRVLNARDLAFAKKKARGSDPAVEIEKRSLLHKVCRFLCKKVCRFCIDLEEVCSVHQKACATQGHDHEGRIEREIWSCHGEDSPFPAHKHVLACPLLMEDGMDRGTGKKNLGCYPGKGCPFQP